MTTGWLSRALLWSLIGAACAMAAASAEEAYSEDALKAAFLYRFTDYVDWPPEALQTQAFNIAVMNDPGVAAQLRKLMPAHPVHGHAVQVQTLTSVRELHDIQVLYVGGSDTAELRRIVSAIGSHPVLIVTDEQNALNAGSVVNFVLTERRLRFEVSLDSAEQTGLRIGSELLSVALHVQRRRPVGPEPEDSPSHRLWAVDQ